MSSLEKLEARVMKNHRIAEYMKSLYPYTPVNIPLLHELLKSHPNQEFVSKLCTGLSSGFRVGYMGGRFPRTAANLPSARQHPHVIEDNLLEEIQLGRLAGPFESPPFVNLQVHPLGLVPKKNSHKWRTIFHLSHPKRSSQSLNAHIPIQEYTLQYIRVDDAIALILKHGPGCFMTKTDIQSTFRIIPIHPEDWELLGMAWKGFYYFDKTLPFGLRSAPFLFNQLSDALEWLIQNHLHIPSVIHILDDFFIAQPPPSSLCATALCHVLTLFEELNIPLEPKKTFRPTQVLEFMGITLDSVKMEARLPEDKLHHTRDMLAAWSSRRSGFLRELQSLIGTLQFACRVISPGRPFMQRIINLTRGSQNQSKTSVSPKNSGKTSSCGKCFSITGMGLAFSFPHTPSPPPKFTSIPMLPDQLAMGFFSTISGFRANGSPPTSSAPLPALALPGKNSTPSTLPLCCGPLPGLTKDSASTAITKPQSQFYQLRAPRYPVS